MKASRPSASACKTGVWLRRHCGSPFRWFGTSAFPAALTLLVVGPLQAAEYYVAPTGSDGNAGTLAAPFATLQKGHDVAAPGDTVWLRGGTYQVSKQIKLSRSGQSDALRIKFWAYARELPVIDFSAYVSINPAVDTPALLVTGNFIHLRGLEIANVPVGASGAHSISAVRSEGASNNTYELLDIHHTFGPGLFISKGTGGNLILNCDSHDNYDKDGSQGDGQNADGFGVHYQESGPSTILRGCRAWLNSDDGYDLISQEVPVTIEDSWAMQNGYANGGSVSPSSGNGNGFKAGSSQNGVRHLLQRNVAWKNKAAGFYANHSSGGNTWLNNTAYMNGAQYNMLASPMGDATATIILSGALAHKMRNNVGFPNKNTNMGGVDSQFNTWDLNIAEASTDFLSTSDAGFKGPRQANGSLPALNFLKLRAGSPLIDKGTNVGLAFVGAAPDLGADEYGAATNGGVAGNAGNAGAAANGGSSGSAGNAASGGSAGTVTGSGGRDSNAGGAKADPESPSGAGGTAGAVLGAAGSSPSSAGSSPSSAGVSGGLSASAGNSAAGLAGSDEPEPKAEGGCSCTLSRSPHAGLAGLLGASALAGLVARRRRRARA